MGRTATKERFTYLGHAHSQVASHQKLVSLQLRLYDNEGEVGLGVHIARQVLNFVDLSLDAVIDSFEESV